MAKNKKGKRRPSQITSESKKHASSGKKNQKPSGGKKNFKMKKSGRQADHTMKKSERQADHTKKKGKTSRWKKKEEEEDSDFEVVDTVSSKVSNEKHYDESDSNSDQEVKDTRKLVAQQNRKKKKAGGFQAMGLSHQVFKGITRKGYKIPTPIQRKTIPLLLDGKDVVAMARTGSGKTAAFLLPMFEKLKIHTAKSGARALILSPTRELALQTLKFTKELGKFTGLKAAVILGGDKMDDQFAALHENPDIVIATPGRLLHVLVEMNMKLRMVEYVVFDEADRLFEMGFQEQLHEIIHRLPETRQTLLFSATLPKLLVEFAKAGLQNPTLIRLDVETKLSDQLQLSYLSCREDDKPATLLHILKNVIPPTEQSVVFVSTKHHAEYLHELLQMANISCSYTYSALDQTARKINVAKFQHRKVMVLIVTDLAARGVDIPLLDNVINFNFPAKPKLFVHRVGRVARAGRSGTAFSLISQEEVPHLIDLHVFLGRALKVVPLDREQKHEDGLYGSVPQSLIDDMEERVRLWMSQSIDLKNLLQVSINAQKKYTKSRQAPAAESIKRFKELSRNGVMPGVHPLFGLDANTGEMERMKLLNTLKSYKGNTTIFETNATSKTRAFEIMKTKRTQHQNVIEKRTSNMTEYQLSHQTPEGATISSQEAADDNDVQNTFSNVIGAKRPSSNSHMFEPKKKKKKSLMIRDEENYLSYRPSDFQTEKGYSLGTTFDQEAASAQFDIAGDEDKVTKKMQSAVRWDRKKKKFVRDEDPKKKKIRTESGAWIPASYKSSAYKEWKNKNKMDADGGGDENSDQDENSHSEGGNRRLQVIGTKGRRWHTQGMEGEGSAKGARNKFKRGRSELKRPEQILKTRKVQEKKMAYQKHREKQKQSRKNFKAQKSR